MTNPRKRSSRFRPSGPQMVGIVLVLILASVWLFGRDSPTSLPLGYGKFKQILHAPGITFQEVRVGREEIRGEIITRDRVSGLEAPEAGGPIPKDQTRIYPFRTPRIGVERDESLQSFLDQRLGAAYQGEEEESPIKAAFSFLLWMMIFVGMMIAALLIMRSLMSGGTFGFGRSKQRNQETDGPKITFSDVAGIDEAVAELREVVDFLKTPDKYQALGGRIPKGVLLVGPPGTGKTLLARAVAGEANVPFFNMSGSDFVELFVGVGASRVRDLFREAEQAAPCIVFIDELDALGRSRTGNSLASHEEREQTLNQLLVEMDGFFSSSGIIIMAATNRPEILDAALLRPGRFDRTIVVDRPDIEGREAILKVHAQKVKLAEDVSLRRVAALTPGMVGADLANLVNEAALLAARRGQECVRMTDFDEAIERGAVGLQRKSRLMKPEEKRRIAVHEAGHALVACAIPNTDPVHKVSIIPRGVGVGGYVLQRPENDRFVMTRSELEGTIKCLLGGTVAEEVVFGDISTGAVSDLQRVNEIAGKMVREFGMSRLGRLFLRDGKGLAFLEGLDGGNGGTSYSEETAREVDLEVRRIIDDCLAFVRDLLGTNQQTLLQVADKLVEKEVLDGDDLRALLIEVGFLPKPVSAPVPVTAGDASDAA